MSQLDTTGSRSLNERIRQILFSPKTEWPVIAGEPATIGSLYRGYVAILAAIPAVAGFIAATMVGFQLPGQGPIRMGVGEGLAAALLQYGLGLGMVYLIAALTNALAPSFGGVADKIAAFKLAAYSLTPAWVTGVFSLFPGFTWLSILGFYGVWLFYLGLTALMRVPAERAPIFTGAVVTATLAASFVIAIIISVLVPLQMPAGQG